MFLWLMIMVGVLFAFLGYKKGFFVMFATLFNLMFAIFVAVLSTPKLLSMNTGYEDSGYYAGASILLLFILIFSVLQFFAYFYFLRDSDDLFPKLFDKAGAVILGFLCGYIICGLVFLTFAVMPCSVRAGASDLCRREQFIRIARPPVQKVCEFLGWYSLHCFEGDTEETIDYLLTLAEEKPLEDTDGAADETLSVPQLLQDRL